VCVCVCVCACARARARINVESVHRKIGGVHDYTFAVQQGCTNLGVCSPGRLDFYSVAPNV
jgi:hypothetical protein